MNDGTPATQQNNLLAIFFMVLTGACMVAVMVNLRYLDESLPSVQVAFIRYLFGLAIIFPFAAQELKLRNLKIPIIKHGIRGTLHGFGVVLWFYSVSQITLSQVTAISYLTPIFTTIGAIIVFKERLTKQRFLAILTAIIGAILILRPGLEVISAGKSAQLFSTLLLAASYLITKNLTKTEGTFLIVFMLNLFATLTLLPFALLIWISPSVIDLGLVLTIAILASFGHYFVTKAVALAPLSVTQPVIFLQLIWSTLIGLLIFGEPIDLLIIIGGGFIVLAITQIAYSEKQTKG
ncbi:MAG: DMT family transporter [Pseudomonadota bacterium]|nr:DMT family transporter [Pseudomonadota bacterium]